MIIIGACIPILQPLVKYVWQRPFFTDRSTSDRHNKYTPNESQLPGAAIPLESDTTTTRKARLGRNAVLARAQREASQESILREHEVPALHLPKGSEDDNRRKQIKRIDEVTISSDIGEVESGMQRAKREAVW